MAYQKKNQKARMERRLALAAARAGHPRGRNAKGDVTPCLLCGDPLYALDPDIQPIHAGCRRRARLERFRVQLRQAPVERPLRRSPHDDVRLYAKTKVPADE